MAATDDILAFAHIGDLHLTTAENVARVFEGDTRLTFHLAPPFLGGQDPDNRPKKRDFGEWMLPMFRILSGMRGLRGTPLDVFGWQGERRRERALARQYEQDMAEVLPKVGIVRRLVDAGELTVLVEIDGGINADTIEQAAAAGSLAAPARRRACPCGPS